MKSKIIAIVLPTLLGVLAVIGLLILFNLIVYNGDGFNSPDNGFFYANCTGNNDYCNDNPVCLDPPSLEKFKSKKRVLGMTIIQLTGLLCLMSGLAFGLVFWERSFGIMELILLSLSGIISFSVYWSVNLITLNLLDKQMVDKHFRVICNN